LRETTLELILRRETWRSQA